MKKISLKEKLLLTSLLPSDKVIDDKGWDMYPQDVFNNGEDFIFAEGAKWMRECIERELNNDR